jgi:hypothetical protein
MILFEENLMPIRDLTDKEILQLHVVCVVNTSRTKPLNSKIKVKDLENFTSSMNMPVQYNHRELVNQLRGLIAHNERRFCEGLRGYETYGFDRDDFLFLTYFVYNKKNYINGFLKVKNCSEYPDIVRTNYICTDVKFSGIGKILIGLLKVSLVYLRIYKVRISSVPRHSTQNFYISQGFYPIPEQIDEGRFVWFEWDFDKHSKKDYISMAKLQIKLMGNKPMFATYETTKANLDNVELIPYRFRTAKSPLPSPRHFMSPRPVVAPVATPRSARSPVEEEEGAMFREVESPRGTAHGRKKRKGTKKRKRRKL